MIIKQPHHRIRLIKVLLSISFNLYRHIFLKKINANNMIKKIGAKPIKSSNVIRKNPSSEPPPSVAPICMVSDTPAGTTIYPVVSKIMSVFSKLHSFLIEAPPRQILIYFIASFAFVLQRCKQRGYRAKPIHLKMDERFQRLPPGGRLFVSPIIT